MLKKYTSGGGGSQTQLISMAMAEASKLFDQSGGGSSGGKQDAVNGAAMTVMKLLVRSKFSGGLAGLVRDRWFQFVSSVLTTTCPVQASKFL